MKIGVIVLLALAFILRIIFIFQGGVSFHYDMGRDAFEAQSIWQDHHLKILGPPTSTPGLFHGVLYYYLIAPVYQLSNGDPRLVAVFLSFINSLVLIPLMLLTKDLFKSNKWTYLGGFLFVIAFEATQYASWISNPAPAVLTMALFFLFLRHWQKGNKWGLYLAVLTAALSTQFQFFLIYLFILIPLFAVIFKIKTPWKAMGISGLIAITGLINFFIAMIKFKTSGHILSGFLNIGAGSQIDFRPQFVETVVNYFNRIAELFINNFIPTSALLGGILAILTIYTIRREKLLCFYLLSNFLIFIFGGHSNTYANIGLVVPGILAVIYLLRNWWKIDKKLVYITVLLFLISNLSAIMKYNPDGQIILVIPNNMNLKNELRLIDKSYQIANYQPFSVNTLTLPLWTNTTWAYLYSWYGQSKYGYVPEFYGHDQVGLLGKDSLKRVDKPLEKTFFIIEPADGIPPKFYNEELDTENSKTQLVNELDYGTIKLQIRVPKSNAQ